VLENKVLKKLLQLIHDQPTEEWRKLHKRRFRTCIIQPDTVMMIKSRMTWAGHVAYMRETGCIHKNLVV
jgi:hypothetical protein